MATIHPAKIKGEWRSGHALDLHTVSSTYLGDNEYGHAIFDTTYSELGTLLRRLKYESDITAASDIISTAIEFLEPYSKKFDLIIPVPPSNERPVQPVAIIAEGLGRGLQLPVVDCVKTTRPPTQLKGVIDPERRRDLLDGLYTMDSKHTAYKNVLLFDDLFRSGSTMNAITSVLLEQGMAKNVYAFTITRTRSNR